MVNEEQKKLCEDLRQIYRYIDNDEINELIWQAADEIERLVKERDEARDMSTRFAKRWTNAIGIDAGLK